ncbi:MAG: hypothetical protein AAF570_28390, partial [Bacteroidota bacterium]
MEQRRIYRLGRGFILFWTLFLVSTTAFAQEDRNLRIANKLYDELSYPAAIHYFQKALKKKFNFEAMTKVAESYRLIKDYDNAEKWYNYVVNTNYVRPEDRLRYGQVLMVRQKYEMALEQFDKYVELRPEDERGAKLIRACEQYQQVRDNPADYKIKNLAINSDQSDFCAVRFEDGIVFSSSRGAGKLIERTYNWDGNPFLDLYFVEDKSEKADEVEEGKEPNIAFGKPRLFKSKFNGKFHEAVACFDEGHELIFFTRNNYKSGKKKTSQEGLVHLSIYYAELEKGGWTNMKPLPFNSEEHSVGHPTVTNDGTTLYF